VEAWRRLKISGVASRGNGGNAAKNNRWARHCGNNDQRRKLAASITWHGKDIIVSEHHVHRRGIGRGISATWAFVSSWCADIRRFRHPVGGKAGECARTHKAVSGIERWRAKASGKRA